MDIKDYKNEYEEIYKIPWGTDTESIERYLQGEIQFLQAELIKIKNLGERSEPPHTLLGEVLADIKESIESDKSSLNNLYGNNALMNKAYFRSLMIVEKCIGKHLA